jgi:hypothetical protein
MKVFNLSCEHDHRFEGWFGSSGDYDSQLQSGLLECPMCGSRTIRKLPSAPRLNLSSAGRDSQPDAQRGASQPPSEAVAMAAAQPGTGDAIRAAREMMVRMAQFLARNTEDVGERFAEEARRIHYREAPERGIRGVATREEAHDLGEEGIEVFSFPVPVASKEPLQ